MSSKLKKIAVEGYKSFGKRQEVRIAPITIFSGVNSSGKSSFLQPILLLKQTAEVGYKPEGLLLNGENIKFYDGSKLFFDKKKYEFSIEYVFSNKTSIKNTYNYIDGNIDIKKCNFKKANSNVSFTNSSFHKTLSKLVDKKSESDVVKSNIKTKFVAKSERGVLKLFEQIEKNNSKFKFFFPYLFCDFSENIREIEKLSSLWHIPGIRGNPERFYVRTSTKDYIGRFENYTAGIINSWKEPQESEKLKLLSSYLIQMGLTKSISTDKKDDAHIAIEVGSLPSVKQNVNDKINVADVGFGVSQILPFLVSLIEAKDNQTIYIEQPELHLHPRAQAKLADILCDVVNEKDINIIIETHSTLIIRRIQTAIATSKIKQKDVSLNWFDMSEDGYTVICEAKLDSSGRYGSWPQDFDDVFMEVDSDYIKASLDAI